MITILRNESINDRFVFEAKDGEEILASLEAVPDGITFRVKKVSGIKMLIDGIMRAALNYADNHSFIHFVTEPQEAAVWEELIRTGFAENDGLIENIEDFFENHKNCKKN